MTNSMTNGNLALITDNALAERQNTLKVVGGNGAPLTPAKEDKKVEYVGSKKYARNPVHEAFLKELNSKPYFGGNPNSELGPGDFLDVYQGPIMYRC